MISAKCITWHSSKQLMFLTYHVHYCPLNIGVSKQTTISCIAKAPKWNIIQKIAFCIHVSKHFCKIIPLDPNSSTPCFYSAFAMTRFQLYANQFDQQHHTICNRENLTFIFVVSDTEWRNNDDSQ